MKQQLQLQQPQQHVSEYKASPHRRKLPGFQAVVRKIGLSLIGHTNKHDPHRCKDSIKSYLKKFDADEIEVLRKVYDELSARNPESGIDKATFLQYFPLPGLWGERLFQRFDYKSLGAVDYEEFLVGIAVCCRGTRFERITVLFQVFDLNGDGVLQRDELVAMLSNLPNLDRYLVGAKKEKTNSSCSLNRSQYPNTITDQVSQKLTSIQHHHPPSNTLSARDITTANISFSDQPSPKKNESFNPPYSPELDLDEENDDEEDDEEDYDEEDDEDYNEDEEDYDEQEMEDGEEKINQNSKLHDAETDPQIGTVQQMETEANNFGTILDNEEFASAAVSLDDNPCIWSEDMYLSPCSFIKKKKKKLKNIKRIKRSISCYEPMICNSSIKHKNKTDFKTTKDNEKNIALIDSDYTTRCPCTPISKDGVQAKNKQVTLSVLPYINVSLASRSNSFPITSQSKALRKTKTWMSNYSRCFPNNHLDVKQDLTQVRGSFSATSSIPDGYLSRNNSEIKTRNSAEQQQIHRRGGNTIDVEAFVDKIIEECEFSETDSLTFMEFKTWLERNDSILAMFNDCLHEEAWGLQGNALYRRNAAASSNSGNNTHSNLTTPQTSSCTASAVNANLQNLRSSNVTERGIFHKKKNAFWFSHQFFTSNTSAARAAPHFQKQFEGKSSAVTRSGFIEIRPDAFYKIKRLFTIPTGQNFIFSNNGVASPSKGLETALASRSLGGVLGTKKQAQYLEHLHESHHQTNNNSQVSCNNSNSQDNNVCTNNVNNNKTDFNRTDSTHNKNNNVDNKYTSNASSSNSGNLNNDNNNLNKLLSSQINSASENYSHNQTVPQHSSQLQSTCLFTHKSNAHTDTTTVLSNNQINNNANLKKSIQSDNTERCTTGCQKTEKENEKNLSGLEQPHASQQPSSVLVNGSNLYENDLPIYSKQTREVLNLQLWNIIASSHPNVSVESLRSDPCNPPFLNSNNKKTKEEKEGSKNNNFSCMAQDNELLSCPSCGSLLAVCPNCHGRFPKLKLQNGSIVVECQKKCLENKDNNVFERCWHCQWSFDKAVERVDQCEPSFEGTLYKIGKHTHKWRKRYFVLIDNLLYYYTRKEDTRPQGLIFLEGCFIEPIMAPSTTHTMLSSTKKASAFSPSYANNNLLTHDHDQQHEIQQNSNCDSSLNSAHHHVGGFIKLGGHIGHYYQKYFGFSIVHGRKKLPLRNFYAGTEHERHVWIKVLRQAVKQHDIADLYSLQELIGQGKFSVVYKAQTIDSTTEAVAIKYIDKSKVSEHENELLRSEISILRLIKHPHVIRFKEILDAQTTIHIVMEYVEGGELYDILQQKQKLPESQVNRIIFQLLTTVAYLHQCGIIHRDLKPENILLTNKTPDADIKITDFGLSCICGPNELVTQPCGTLAYVAPEVLTLKGYNHKVDVWSVGVIMFLLLRGRLPFPIVDRRAIMTGQPGSAKSHYQRPLVFEGPIWDNICSGAKDLLRKLLQPIPEKRISAQEALQHIWLKNPTAVMTTDTVEETEPKFHKNNTNNSATVSTEKARPVVASSQENPSINNHTKTKNDTSASMESSCTNNNDNKKADQKQRKLHAPPSTFSSIDNSDKKQQQPNSYDSTRISSDLLDVSASTFTILVSPSITTTAAKGKK